MKDWNVEYGVKNWEMIDKPREPTMRELTIGFIQIGLIIGALFFFLVYM